MTSVLANTGRHHTQPEDILFVPDTFSCPSPAVGEGFWAALSGAHALVWARVLHGEAPGPVVCGALSSACFLQKPPLPPVALCAATMEGGGSTPQAVFLPLDICLPAPHSSAVGKGPGITSCSYSGVHSFKGAVSLETEGQVSSSSSRCSAGDLGRCISLGHISLTDHISLCSFLPCSFSNLNLPRYHLLDMRIVTQLA
jgi:hypothetical protein